jgi:hypothetical protein
MMFYIQDPEHWKRYKKLPRKQGSTAWIWGHEEYARDLLVSGGMDHVEKETSYIWFTFNLNLLLKIIHHNRQIYQPYVYDLICRHLALCNDDTLCSMFGNTKRRKQWPILPLKRLVDVPTDTDETRMYHQISTAKMPEIADAFISFADQIDLMVANRTMKLMNDICIDAYMGAYVGELSEDPETLSNLFNRTLIKKISA